MINVHGTVSLEQHRVKLNAVTKIGPVVVRMLDDTLAAIASHVKPIEQLPDRVSERAGWFGYSRPIPRGLVEYEAHVHEFELRRAARVARSI